MSGGHRRFPRAKLRIQNSPTEKLGGGGQLLDNFWTTSRPSGQLLVMSGQLLANFWPTLGG